MAAERHLASPAELLLPPLERFEPTSPLRHGLARIDRLQDAPRGYLAALAQRFERVDGTPLPIAAITRQYVAGDAGDAIWLCADPAWVQPELTGARLLATGRMELTQADADALAQTLVPVFAEAGMELFVTSRDRWHLRLSPETPLPAFPGPEQALGESLLPHLPQGRLWRVLLNDVQVLLHNHPINQWRRERQLPPVNSLWLWGGGVLATTTLHTRVRQVIGSDPLLAAIANVAGCAQMQRAPKELSSLGLGCLVDLVDLAPAQIDRHWWPAIERQARRQRMWFSFVSGERFESVPLDRWRFWRRGAV